MDLVIRDARVIDGTGGASYRADVGVDAGRVTAIRREGGGPALTGGRVLDAHGLALAPGFIDMHAHSDLARLRLTLRPGGPDDGSGTLAAANTGAPLDAAGA
ncbi:hypothetical protein ACWDPI_02290, partial [Streptomyces zhihengii]